GADAPAGAQRRVGLGDQRDQAGPHRGPARGVGDDPTEGGVVGERRGQHRGARVAVRRVGGPDGPLGGGGGGRAHDAPSFSGRCRPLRREAGPHTGRPDLPPAQGRRPIGGWAAPDAAGTVIGRPDARYGGQRMSADPSLVGRDRELATLTGMLGVRRLVTITGVGGVGKTRLALAVAARTPHAAVCHLARRSRADQVREAVAEALGYPSWDAALVGLAERTALLVLDNCEHLLDAAADAVELLLAAAPGVSVLATSREPLAVPDEHVLR